MTAFRILKVKVTASTNIKFSGCTFQHLGGVYALGADQGSQSIVVVNSTFTDVSGGGVRAQKSFPFPNPQTLFFFLKKKKKNLEHHFLIESSSSSFCCFFFARPSKKVKLGSSGERGAAAPAVTTPPSDQDRGFYIADNLLTGIPAEYSGANPIFAGYVADTALVHNTIHDSRRSTSLLLL